MKAPVLGLALSFLLLSGLVRAEESGRAAIEKVYPKWGFVVVANDRFEGVGIGDVLDVETRNRETVRLVVAELKETLLVAELPGKEAKKIEWMAPGDPVVAHRKGTTREDAADAEVSGSLPEGSRVIGWNRQWGFVVIRASDGTESIRFDRGDAGE